MKGVSDFSIKITQHIGTPISLILHTLFFIGIFGLRVFGIKIDDIMLVLTTIVSLEAIYLSILIQLTVNRQTIKLTEVQKDIAEVQKDIEEVQDTVNEDNNNM